MPAAPAASRATGSYRDLQSKAAVSSSPAERAKAGQRVWERKGGSRNVSPNSMFENKQFLPQSQLWGSQIVSEEEKGKTEREKS